MNVRNNVNVGVTPLHYAVRGKNLANVVELFLKNKADANLQNPSGNTPLHMYTREGLCDISQLLVGSGCEINVTNNLGKRLFILLFVVRM